MSTTAPPKKPPPRPGSKEARRAEALRANLGKRKQQERARNTEEKK